MLTKTFVRFLILALFFTSVLIVTMSTQTEALRLSCPTDTSIGKTWLGLGSKTKATAKVTWLHATAADSLFGPHNHRLTYSLYARVADQSDYNPPLLEDGRHEYANEIISSWTRFRTSRSEYAAAKAVERWENDAHASAYASDATTPDNWNFNPKP